MIAVKRFDNDRIADPINRGFELVLTPAGRARLEQARQTHRADVRSRFLKPLDSREQELLGDIWERLGGGSQDIGSV